MKQMVETMQPNRVPKLLRICCCSADARLIRATPVTRARVSRSIALFLAFALLAGGMVEETRADLSGI